MNQDVMKGEWTVLKAKIQQKWAKLTDNDLGRIQGNFNELVGRLQQTYGYTREKAWAEFDEFKRSLTDGAQAAGREAPHREAQQQRPSRTG